MESNQSKISFSADSKAYEESANRISEDCADILAKIEKIEKFEIEQMEVNSILGGLKE